VSGWKSKPAVPRALLVEEAVEHACAAEGESREILVGGGKAQRAHRALQPARRIDRPEPTGVAVRHRNRVEGAAVVERQASLGDAARRRTHQRALARGPVDEVEGSGSPDVERDESSVVVVPLEPGDPFQRCSRDGEWRQEGRLPRGEVEPPEVRRLAGFIHREQRRTRVGRRGEQQEQQEVRSQTRQGTGWHWTPRYAGGGGGADRRAGSIGLARPTAFPLGSSTIA
jgi:hypothetical protein